MNKLVRDFIPKLIEKAGKKPVGYIAGEAEYQRRILDKLVEEANELKESQSLEELADVLEVIDAIYVTFQFNKEDVYSVKERKKEERGGFLGRYILSDVEE